MNKSELKELVKQVVAEETEYQKLFKTMLDRSGKDINSMSDEEKKKFFNAVDKVYKAKSEGKLIDSKKKEAINESIMDLMTNPFVIVFLSRFIWEFVREGIYQLMKYNDKDQFDEIAKYMQNKLIKDANFLKKFQSIVKKSGGKFDDEQATELRNSSELQKVAREARIWHANLRKKQGKPADIPYEVIAHEVATLLVKAWHDDSLKNKIIEKIKKDIQK